LKKYFSEGAPRPFKPHYKNYDNNYEGGNHHHQNNHYGGGGYKQHQNMADDGFEVVKKRGEQQQ